MYDEEFFIRETDVYAGFQCESKFRLSKRHQDSESSTSQEEEQEEDTDDESGATVGARVSHYVRQGLYYVTDSERFQPPRKRQKLVVSSCVVEILNRNKLDYVLWLFIPMSYISHH